MSTILMQQFICTTKTIVFTDVLPEEKEQHPSWTCGTVIVGWTMTETGEMLTIMLYGD